MKKYVKLYEEFIESENIPDGHPGFIQDKNEAIEWIKKYFNKDSLDCTFRQDAKLGLICDVATRYDSTWMEPKNVLTIRDNNEFHWIRVRFGAIKKGNFSLYGFKYLKSLYGCPRRVAGSFNINTCSSINTLKYGPIYVGGDYRVQGTSISNLSHSPRLIGRGGTFLASWCPNLTSLDGLSEGGSIKKLDISNNINLHSLYGIENHTNIDNINVNESGLWTLEYLPNDFGELRGKLNRLIIFDHITPQRGDLKILGRLSPVEEVESEDVKIKRFIEHWIPNSPDVQHTMDWLAQVNPEFNQKVVEYALQNGIDLGFSDDVKDIASTALKGNHKLG